MSPVRTSAERFAGNHCRKWVLGAALLTGFLIYGRVAEAAEFFCTGGDVACLIAAINAANANGQENVITLAPGNYTLLNADNLVDGPTGLPVITSKLAIKGAAAETTIIQRSPTLINLEHRFRILSVAASGSLSLDRVTVAHGRFRDPGATFPPIHAGGGIMNRGSLMITNSTITKNQADSCPGGGIFNDGGAVTIADSSLIDNNVNLGGGGAMTSRNGTLTISQSTISENGANGNDPGVRVDGGTAVITNTTISDNNSNGPGGALTAANNAHVTVTNSTITTHFGPGEGSQRGVFVFSGSWLSLQNTIVAQNGGDSRFPNTPFPPNKRDCDGPVTSLGNNFIGIPGSCVLASTDLTGDARLGQYINPGAPGTAHVPLLADSPAIDAANNAACDAADQLHRPRPADGNGDGARICDIGAVEFYPVVSDLMSLDSVGGAFLPPDPSNPSLNAIAPGGRYRVDALFTNTSARNICNVAFHVITLQGVSGGKPVVLKPDGETVGGEGAVVPAEAAGGPKDLRAGEQQPYSLFIGLGVRERFTFFVNVLGERSNAPCGP